MRRAGVRWIPVTVLVAATLSGMLWFGAGCEKGSGKALTIDPANARIGRNITQLTLTIVGGLGDLSQPIEWTVADPTLGAITHRGGLTAIYTRTAKNGLNVITAKDQYDVEGHATVEQISQTTASVETTTVTNAATSGTTTAVRVTSPF